MTHYSMQLQDALLPCMTFGHYQEIALGCHVVDSTIECDLSVLEDALLGLGDRLVHLMICGRKKNVDVGAVRRGAESYQRLRKIQWMEITPADAPVLETLLSSGCNELRSLKIDQNLNEQRVDIMTSGVTPTREFRFCRVSTFLNNL